MPDSRFEQFCAFVQTEMARLHVPGVAVGIVDGDEEHTAGFGVTNTEHPLPVTADTLFQIGSITKTVTATVAMRLVEGGALDLDAPLRRYLPELRLADEETAARVTAHHLLTHTGGWAGDYFDDGGPGDDALQNMLGKVAELPQIYPLGRYWSYNNAGFYLAGRLLEVLSGMPYEALARKWVLDPLGMRMSFFFAADCITHRVAVGHQPVYDGQGTPQVWRPWALPRSMNPMGGIVSTVNDLLRYARFQMGDGTAADGTRLLAAESLRWMQSPYVSAGNGESMGLAWFIRDLTGAQAGSRAAVRIIRHGGGTKGQISTFQVAPARRFAVTILTNSGRGDELTLPAARWAIEHYLDAAERDPEPVAADAARLAEYAGRYTAPGEEMRLRVEGDRLVLDLVPLNGFPTPDTPPPPAPPPVRAALCGEDRMIVVEDPGKGERGEFLREAGRVAWLRMGGRLHKRADV